MQPLFLEKVIKSRKGKQRFFPTDQVILLVAERKGNEGVDLLFIKRKHDGEFAT